MNGSQSARSFRALPAKKFSVAGDSLEGESPGELRFMSSEPEPGLAASPKSSSKGRMEALNFKPEARASVGSPPVALRSPSAIIFRPWRKTAVGSIRDNNAAWVAGPSRICFYGSQATGGRVRTLRPSTHSRKIKFGLVRSGPAPATAHPESRDHPGLVLVPASVWVRGRGRAAADAMDRSARADTTRARNANLIWQTL